MITSFNLHPEYPVNIKYVNHGKVFGNADWFTFYCGNCDKQVCRDDKECQRCGAILQDGQRQDQITAERGDK